MEGPYMRVMAVLIGLVVLAADARAQGLGEAAERERQRQEKVRQGGGAAKVITAEELAANPGKLANDPSIPPAVAAAPLSSSGSRRVGATTSSSATSTGASTSSGTGFVALGSEASVRSAVRGLRQNIARLEAEVQALDGKATGLAYGKAGGALPPPKDQHGNVYRTATPPAGGGDALALLQWRKERGEVLDRLERARTALTKARADLATLEEGARRQGVPAGWLRE